jgi:hypothetical protein
VVKIYHLGHPRFHSFVHDLGRHPFSYADLISVRSFGRVPGRPELNHPPGNGPKDRQKLGRRYRASHQGALTFSVKDAAVAAMILRVDHLFTGRPK